LRILKEITPDIVIGLGGYSSGPLVAIASLKGIPTLILEQNAIPGLTNRILSRVVDAIAINFKSSEGFFSDLKIHLTGNPVREEITSGKKEEGLKKFGLDEGLFTVLIFGGSAGAHRINKAMVEAISYLNALKNRIQIIHQTGDKDYAEMSEFYRSRGFKIAVLPFIDSMADAYAASDLVVSRAGAGTLSEITACGKPSILIPYPYAAKNHQEINARILLDEGAAMLILDKELDGKRLVSEIRFLMEDPERLWQMEKASKRLGISDAARKIVDLAMGLVRVKSSLNSELRTLDSKL
jgi:UDP-N-acetylglucosamine--N-acetylmuramyl-(pentapeptide) pyrophosphoryl-undecaprenol N-acetylglucosamine transferase